MRRPLRRIYDSDFASAFALKIGDHLFGVTAGHVVKAYLDERRTFGRLHFCVGDQDIELDVIDLGHGIDVATFALSSQMMNRIQKTPFTYRPEQWLQFPDGRRH